MTAGKRLIVAAITDLMFQSRVRDPAVALGYEVVVADSDSAVRDAIDGAALLIVDLHAMGLDWRAAVSAAKERGVPVLAFGRHTEAALLRDARDAGVDRVVARSTLVEEFASLVGDILRVPR
jgi:hypothetical protein